PPKMIPCGRAPLASSKVIVSLPAWPKTVIELVLATVGVPPKTVTAPPLTRILPAASRLTVRALPAASPKTDSGPPADGRNRANRAGTSRASRARTDGTNRAGRAGLPPRRAPRSMALNKARSIYGLLHKRRQREETGLSSGLAGGRGVRREARVIHDPAGGGG